MQRSRTADETTTNKERRIERAESRSEIKNAETWHHVLELYGWYRELEL